MVNIQVGILSETLLYTPESLLTSKVELRSEELVHAKSQGFGGNDVSHLLDKLWVE
jgi:hypothetical protein